MASSSLLRAPHLHISNHLTLLLGFTSGITIQNRTLHSHPHLIPQNFWYRPSLLNKWHHLLLMSKLENHPWLLFSISQSQLLLNSIDSSFIMSLHSTSKSVLLPAFITSPLQYSNYLLTCISLHPFLILQSYLIKSGLYNTWVGFILHSEKHTSFMAYEIWFLPTSDLIFYLSPSWSLALSSLPSFSSLNSSFLS